MERAITSVIESTLLQEISASIYIGIMLDETCDISIDKKLVVYIRYLKDGKVQVAYVGNENIRLHSPGYQVSIDVISAEKRNNH